MSSDASSANLRAEELLDQAGERLGRWSSEAYLQLRKAAALLREEAEDIWAEAQSLRAGTETPHSPSLGEPKSA